LTTAAPAPAPPVLDAGVFSFRKTARKRTWVCPGAGFDYLGRPIAAVSCYATSIAALLCGIVTALNPTPTTFWATIALAVLGTLLWCYELFSTLNAWPRQERPRSRLNPWYGMLGIWVMIGLFGIVMATSFQVTAFEESPMSPAIEDKEKILVHRGVDEDRLTRGSLVLFELDSLNGLDEPGKLAIGRIIAVPGDKLATKRFERTTRYMINGTPAETQAQIAGGTVVITVPAEALNKPLVVPEGSYFIMQDSPDVGYDSRVLGYAKLSRIKSTKMFRFGKSNFLATIE
jgi:signal peptidase I